MCVAEFQYVYLYVNINIYIYTYIWGTIEIASFQTIWMFAYSLADLNIQHVPAKMRLEKGTEMQVEILNGGEILVHCKFKPQS